MNERGTAHEGNVQAGDAEGRHRLAQQPSLHSLQNAHQPAARKTSRSNQDHELTLCSLVLCSARCLHLLHDAHQRRATQPEPTKTIFGAGRSIEKRKLCLWSEVLAQSQSEKKTTENH